MGINLSYSDVNIELQIAQSKADFLQELDRQFSPEEYTPSFVLRLLDIGLSKKEIIYIISNRKLLLISMALQDKVNLLLEKSKL